MRRRLIRGKKIPLVGYVLSFLVGSLLMMGVYTTLILKKPISPGTPPSKTTPIDQVIQSQLYEIGLSRKDVLHQQSALKREGGETWKQSFLKIQVPRSLSFSKIEKNFGQAIPQADKNLTLESTWKGGTLQLKVKVMGRTTHQLTFIPSGVPQLPMARGEQPARVAIVIDDLGEDKEIARELFDVNVPITLSILPFASYSKTLAQEAHQKGKEVLLHLPMEPHGYPKAKPGRGVLLQGMDEKGLLHQLSEDIEAVPHITGVSNHMGSLLMEDRGRLEIVFSELKKRGFFFLDSRTTAQTVGLGTAKSIGLRATERDVFLDHASDENTIQQSFQRLAELSLSTGRAIGIGHPHPLTIKLLKKMIPVLQEKGIEVVPLSDLVEW